MELPRRSVLRGAGIAAALGGAGTLGYAEFGSGAPSPTVDALVAGSLLELADDVPGATVEAHGSVAVRRLILDGLRSPDAVALADPRLFAGIADRATVFATNAVVIAYDPLSPFASDLEADWRSAIGAPGIALGRTDPEKDPLGYRTVMVLSLAEREFGVDADGVLSRTTVFIETDLLNVLEGGQIDAAFCYRNMAVQRGLPYVGLPDVIDFSNPDFAERYASVSADLEAGTVRGAPIQYAAAALSEAGALWVDRLVSAGPALRAAGFDVPADYPVGDVPIERFP